MTGQSIGEAWATGIQEGMRKHGSTIRRATWQMQEVGARLRAELAQQHADWFVSLPWWRRFWVQVRGQ